MRICSLLALREVADPSQLNAEALVLGHVQHSVRLAAVQRHSAPGTLVQHRSVLCLDRARMVLALSDLPLRGLRNFFVFDERLLISEGELRIRVKDSRYGMKK
jgi:hypothetical protein